MSDKYTLTKKGFAPVNTSSETVKHRYLADGYALKTKPSAPAPASTSNTSNTSTNK